MKSVSLFFCILAIYSALSDGLYFYLEGSEKKCFLEELPKETMVTGIYKAEQYSEAQNAWVVNTQIKVRTFVEEITSNYALVDRIGGPSGQFTFTSTESGDHSICLSVNTESWFDSTKTRVTFDMDFDDPTGDHHDHKETLSDLAKRIHELNERVQDIRREQFFQKEREAEFRDLSEYTNSRIVWWTVLQIVVLGVVCVWQMRHFKSFFVAKKLV